MSPSFSLLLFLFLSLQGSTALVPRSRLTTSELKSQPPSSSSPPPTTFFQVTKPINPPSSSPPCSTLVLRHDFAYTYSKPPVAAPYAPPSCLLHRPPPSLAVLEWSAASRGRQFDRIFGVWLSGVELLRSCTAEPRPTGIRWSVQKDVTRYLSLLSHPQTLSVFLGNIVDRTYTGVYHVNVSLHFYFPDHRQPPTAPPPPIRTPADLILPVSRTHPGNDGLWFRVQNSTDSQSTDLAVPRNAYRAVLEVYVSCHQDDEFWYTNPPNEYIERNNISGLAGNGAFREVAVSLDGAVVGAVWPFTVIYTGGINPLLWRPITGIGSFDLPAYEIDITPFLGKILDGKKHRFGFWVTDALDVWFVDANLHLWLDSKSTQTVGGLINHVAPEFTPSVVSEYSGLDGRFDTSARRQISATGWVKSSHGKITTRIYQSFGFKNLMEFKANGTVQVVNQSIDFNHGTFARSMSSILYSEHVFRTFPLYVRTATADEVNDSYSLVSNVMLGFNERRYAGDRSGFRYSSLRNSQDGEGIMQVKGNLVVGGVGGTRQVYRYESMDDCYFRNVSSHNYTILNDESGHSCTKGLAFLR